MDRLNSRSLIESLPPGLTIWQAAAMLRQSYSRVRNLMLRFHYLPLDGRRLRWKLAPPRTRVPWDRVNWRLSNIVLATRYRVSREIVRRMRNRLQKPFVESRGAKPKGKGSSNGRYTVRKTHRLSKVI